MFIQLNETALKQSLAEIVAEFGLKDAKKLDAVAVSAALVQKYKEKTPDEAPYQHKDPNLVKVLNAVIKAFELLNGHSGHTVPEAFESLVQGIRMMQFIERQITAYKSSSVGMLADRIDSDRASENEYAAAIYGWTLSVAYQGPGLRPSYDSVDKAHRIVPGCMNLIAGAVAKCREIDAQRASAASSTSVPRPRLGA